MIRIIPLEAGIVNKRLMYRLSGDRLAGVDYLVS